MTYSEQRPATLGARRSAFTLIETSLALLAIGIGLIAIFGLGRLGLQSNKESLNDQRCAMLSNAIFETLRERNAYFVDLARTNGLGQIWYNFWMDAAQDGRIAFPPVANLAPLTANLIFGATTTAYDPGKISLANWNPRYRLDVHGAEGSPVALGHNIFRATLTIYPDGDTYSSEARAYTITLTNPGGLP
jgi:hypothetical protein